MRLINLGIQTYEGTEKSVGKFPCKEVLVFETLLLKDGSCYHLSTTKKYISIPLLQHGGIISKI